MHPTEEAPKSLLSNLRPHHVVHVFNPLSDDFRWSVARSVTHLDPKHVDPYIEKMNMRNADHPTLSHVQQWITLPSGKSYKMPGDVAQVVVKHLVDEILNREGHKQNIGDPVLRREVEERVILNINDLRTKLSTQSVEEQLEQQLREMNQDETVASEEPQDEEQPFPTLQDSGVTPNGGSGSTGGEEAFAGVKPDSQGTPELSQTKRPGRPRKV